MSRNRMSAELERRVAALSDEISANTFVNILQEALPEGIAVRQVMRDALAVVEKTPELAACHGPSVLGGLVTTAQLGLRLGVAGLGHAYLLPMWNSRESRKDATLVIGYKGYVELAMRHPEVGAVFADCVYQGDNFTMTRTAAGEDLVHEFGDSRTNPQKYYAVARFTNGTHFVTRPWTQADMNAHRDKYAMAKTKEGKIVGPWALGRNGEITDQAVEMAKKTMIRGPLVKGLPLLPQLASAVVVDEGGVRTELDPTLDPAEVTTHPNRPEETPAEKRDPSQPVRESINLNGRAPQPNQPGAPGMLTGDQDRDIIRLVRERGLKKDAALDLVEKTIGERKSARQLTEAQAAKVIIALEAIPIPEMSGQVMLPGKPTMPAQDPAEPLPPDEEIQDAGVVDDPPVAKERLTPMNIAIGERGITPHTGKGSTAANKAAKTEWLNTTVNRPAGQPPIESTADLTESEADLVMQTLKGMPIVNPGKPKQQAPAAQPQQQDPAARRTRMLNLFGALDIGGEEMLRDISIIVGATVNMATPPTLQQMNDAIDVLEAADGDPDTYDSMIAQIEEARAASAEN